MRKALAPVGIVFTKMNDDMPNPQPELNETGYGYDELKDFDMGLKDNRKSKITPFMGPNR